MDLITDHAQESLPEVIPPLPPTPDLARPVPDARRKGFAGTAVRVLFVLGTTVAIAYLGSTFVLPRLSSKSQARARIVAASAIKVHSPCDGVFIPSSTAIEGRRIRQGETLGTVEAPALASELNRCSEVLNLLKEERLKLARAGGWRDSRLPGGDELASQIAVAEIEFARLSGLNRLRTVTSPCAGRLATSIRSSRSVRANDEMVEIWPDGSDLELELEAPISVINDVLSEGLVHADFVTHSGSVRVAAQPDGNSVAMYTNERKGNEIWGRVRCQISTDLEDPVRFIGSVGTLKVDIW
jgi:hypothetical protein